VKEQRSVFYFNVYLKKNLFGRESSDKFNGGRVDLSRVWLRFKPPESLHFKQ